MGRSDLQGTPWHYEYLKNEKEHDSTNCVFNIGHCSCKASINHSQECVGKLNCDDFERKMHSSKHKELIHTNNQPYPNTNISKSHNKKKKVKIVSVGDSITVAHIKTNEQINIPIRDNKNPFVGKRLHEIITIKGEMYSVRKITNGR